MSHPLSSSAPLLALLAALVLPADVSAVPLNQNTPAPEPTLTTFNLDGTEGNTTFSQTIDGITLDVTNFGYSEVRGIAINRDYQTVFNLTFDKDVTLVGYTIRDASASTGTFNIVGPDGSTLGNTAVNGSHFFNTTYSPAANGTLTFSAHDLVGGYIVDSFTVSTPAVPEPGTWALFGLGGAALAGLGLRRNHANRR